jgi:hypothetical protein
MVPLQPTRAFVCERGNPNTLCEHGRVKTLSRELEGLLCSEAVVNVDRERLTKRSSSSTSRLAPPHYHSTSCISVIFSHHGRQVIRARNCPITPRMLVEAPLSS